MILQYQSVSGQFWDLKIEPIRTRSANFHDFQWKPQGVTLQYGDKVTRFDKQSVVYDALLDVSGTIGDRKDALNELHTAFETDIAMMAPGRIVHGDWYIQCYIIASKTFYKHPYTQNQISIYCPYPFWIYETAIAFTSGDYYQDEFLDYRIGYDYDYTPVYASKEITISSPFGANMVVSIRGERGSTKWNHDIDQIIYFDGKERFNVSRIYQGDTSFNLTIDTKNKSVWGNGNWFNRRTKTSDFFAPLSSGTHTISFPRGLQGTIVFAQERSEPLWT